MRGLQFLLIGRYIFVSLEWQVSHWLLVVVACSVSLAAGLVILISTIKNLLESRLLPTAVMPDTKLPTVTVAIPARNEDIQLKECLEAVLASDYPKMEIIVYDDCSQDKTAEIIKSFAHDGVRFIKGDKIKANWLAKNYACQKLLEESTGEIIIYSGVDVRFSVSTISQLVDYLKHNNLQMLCALPVRYKHGLVAALIQPMRYWWELALPKRFFKHPPVLSTCWLMQRAALEKIGGFKAVAKAIIPEEHFAIQTKLVKAYDFIRSSNQLGLYTQKTFIDQWLTAVRTRYPQDHKQPFRLAAKTLLMLMFLLAPIVAFIVALSTNAPLLIILLTGFNCLSLIASHVAINYVTNPKATALSVVNFWLVVLLDIVAMHISMYRYEFSEVVWRGRKVSQPVMQVYERLPSS